jgi:hypothetical protein
MQGLVLSTLSGSVLETILLLRYHLMMIAYTLGLNSELHSLLLSQYSMGMQYIQLLRIMQISQVWPILILDSSTCHITWLLGQWWWHCSELLVWIKVLWGWRPELLAPDVTSECPM